MSSKSTTSGRAYKRVKAEARAPRRRSRRSHRSVDSLAVALVRGRGKCQLSYAKNPFPPMLLTKMTYAVSMVYDMTTTGYSINTFRANSMYDPDYTGTGTQPRYFDTLLSGNDTNAPYRKFCVYKAHIKATYYQYGADTYSAQGLASITWRTTGASAPSSIAEVMMRDDTVTKPAGIANNAGINTIECDVYPGRVLGYRDPVEVSTCWGSFNSNPSDEVYVDIGMWSGSAATVGTYRVMIQITYFAQLSNKNDVTDS